MSRPAFSNWSSYARIPSRKRAQPLLRKMEAARRDGDLMLTAASTISAGDMLAIDVATGTISNPQLTSMQGTVSTLVATRAAKLVVFDGNATSFNKGITVQAAGGVAGEPR